MDFEADGRTARRRVLGLSLAAVGAAVGPRALRAAPGDAQIRVWPADTPTPALALPDVAGHDWRLASVRGSVVALNFWASWCAPCRAEMPSLEALQRRARAQGLAVVTVNYKEAAPDVRRFLQASPVDLPVLLDASGDTTGAWTPRVFPTTVLVDRAGAARTVVVGALDWSGAEAARWLAPLLAAPRPKSA